MMKPISSNNSSPTLISSTSDFSQTPVSLQAKFSLNQNYNSQSQFPQDIDKQCTNFQKQCYKWEKNMEKRIINYLNEQEIDLISPTRKKTNYFTFQKGNALQIGSKTALSSIQPPSNQIQLIKLKQFEIGESKILKKRQQAKQLK